MEEKRSFTVETRERLMLAALGKAASVSQLCDRSGSVRTTAYKRLGQQKAKG